MPDAMAPDELDAILDHLASVRYEPREVSFLEGGLTNINVHVKTVDLDVVVRISNEDSTMLSIDREAEYLNSRAAAASGASPRVVEFMPEHHLLVVDFITGTTYTPQDVADPTKLRRIADAVRTLHNGPRFVSEFDMFDVQQAYLKTVQQRGYRLPDRYLEFVPQIDRMRKALAVIEVGTVPCNNDLLAANFIDDGERVWIIDFEYAGNNDPCFELGNIWSESTLDPPLLDELVTAYFGREWPSMVARSRLLGLLSKYGWMLWASIQDGNSDLDFDFWSWGLEKYDRAVEEFDSPEFESWLTAAAAPD
ncbi:MAG: choline/ethanolamine kinase family protein [Nocardioidaceae bacterium]